MTVTAKTNRDIDGFSKQKMPNLAYTGIKHAQTLLCHHEQKARLVPPTSPHGSVFRGERFSYK